MDNKTIPGDFWRPRRCFREPIPEIRKAADLLSRAVNAHLRVETTEARILFAESNMQEVRAWTESLWGSSKKNPDQQLYLRNREVPGAPAEMKVRERMPSTPILRQILLEQGRHCRFCGNPLIGRWVRDAIVRAYPEHAPWGNTNITQHAALQCLWLQFDHVVPWSRGGDSSPTNIVLTCAPCNYGRGHKLLEECGLLDPRKFAVRRSDWDGLERFPHKPL